MDQHRLNRIRFLSQRFHELQGFRVAFTGLCITVGLGSYLAVAGRPTDNGALVALLVSFVPVVPGMWWLNRHYTSTFGRQVSAPASQWRKLAIIPSSGSWRTQRPIPVDSGRCAHAHVRRDRLRLAAIRDWPWRTYYLGATAAVALTFAASASGSGVLGPGRTLGAMFSRSEYRWCQSACSITSCLCGW